jgi:DNA-binding IclR family transcriptional regulator
MSDLTAIITYLRAQPDATAAQVAAALDMPFSTAADLLSLLCRKGAVKRRQAWGQSPRYRVIDGGKAEDDWRDEGATN